MNNNFIDLLKCGSLIITLILIICVTVYFSAYVLNTIFEYFTLIGIN